MRLETIIKLERNAARLRDIIAVLAKYGLADWFRHVDWKWLQDHFKSLEGQPVANLSTAERIRLALTELGTTFIKLGQILSTRPDLIGPDIADELAKLQANTPADPPDTVRAVFASELGHPPETLFAEFDDVPLASASIAQVHGARLRSGERVVVKVQHSGIEETIQRDLDLLLGLAELAERHSTTLRLYQPVATARQFRRTLLRELDFTHERHNLETFASRFQDDDTVHFPAVFAALCGRRVLTMERLEGVPGTDVAALRQSGQDLNQFARNGATMYLHMIFRDGFYHADPHPGNLMLLEDTVVGVLDCGMVGRLDEELRGEIENLLLAAAHRDARLLTDTVIRLGTVPSECDRNELQADITDLVEDSLGQSVAEFNLSVTLTGLLDVIRRHHILLPSSLSMLLKVLVMLEGTARRLEPQFSLAELMQPFCVESMKRRLSPGHLGRRLGHTLSEWQRLADNLPRDLSEILARVRSGTFNINLHHRRLETTVNRLIIAILTAALILGSSLLWSMRAPPEIAGISVFGALGYAVAAWLGFRLIRAIHKTGDLRPEDDGS